MKNKLIKISRKLHCGLCNVEINGVGHNGSPLIDAKVCNECNRKVIAIRKSNLSVTKKQNRGRIIEIDESGFGEKLSVAEFKALMEEK